MNNNLLHATDWPRAELSHSFILLLSFFFCDRRLIDSCNPNRDIFRTNRTDSPFAAITPAIPRHNRYFMLGRSCRRQRICTTRYTFTRDRCYVPLTRTETRETAEKWRRRYMEFIIEAQWGTYVRKYDMRHEGDRNVLHNVQIRCLAKRTSPGNFS